MESDKIERRLEVDGVCVYDYVLIPGYENSVPSPCVVVYARIDTGLLFIYAYTCPSWLTVRKAQRFADRVIEKGTINPLMWQFQGVLNA